MGLLERLHSSHRKAGHRPVIMTVSITAPVTAQTGDAPK